MGQRCLYEGKAKQVFETEEPDVLRIVYKDEATAFNGEKKEVLEGKGRLNNEISSRLFQLLQEKGIQSHFVRRLSDTEQLVRRVDIVPLEVVVRNTAAGSIVRRTGLARGTVLQPPVIEFYYKQDDLGDPLLNEAHIAQLQLAWPWELRSMEDMARAVNSALLDVFADAGLDLVDFKLEFGRTPDGELMLADEVSPDTCRLWDQETGESLDKDVFRFGDGGLQDVYEQILQRLGGTPDGENV
ncbi:phosphoribosylaminoimidazolesuccinocarboxamide synthase [Alkalicoccus chagannorensis]|uniref:phosphoribosylaminoimidazolesuccinocarboxamide synthase n=1 Tax=Alkalicoccus chagannorensis TaxID=427072 RepID=UPI0004093713|nr:phosphoribosylaminoimidazolesuccinocarboxamide synthase [Alkalicoccus chagannorensis]